MLKLIRPVAVVALTPVVFLPFAPDLAQAETFCLEEANVSSINQAFDAGALTSEQLVQL